MAKIIKLTESDIYKIVNKVIKESEDSFKNKIEDQLDSLINEFGIPESKSYEQLSGVEIKEIMHNYDEMINSFKILKNMVYTYKDNFEGNKKKSIFQKMFSKDEREKVSDLLYNTPTSRKINREIIELGRSYLTSNKIVPADEKMDMFNNMIDLLSDKVDYVKEIKKELQSKLKDRKNHIDRKGD